MSEKCPKIFAQGLWAIIRQFLDNFRTFVDICHDSYLSGLSNPLPVTTSMRPQKPVPDEISGPMGAPLLSGAGLWFGNLIGRTQLHSALALDKKWSAAGNSMTSSERPSPEPLLKKEASLAVLRGREFWKCSGNL